MEAVLYLIPAPLGEEPFEHVITPHCLAIIASLDYFVVEELRTARRYLSKAGKKGQIESLFFKELNEHSTADDALEALQPLLEGHNVGLISEAGLPAVADPGASLVALAHTKGIRVEPLTGPSSLFLAMMASGLNGQNFAFNGYLPVKPEERKQKIKTFETRSLQEGQTQIFIETPYRNQALFEALIQQCRNETRICLAANLTQSDSYIRTATVGWWKHHSKEAVEQIGKKPCVFLMQA